MNDKMKKWIYSAAIRAIKTVAQTALSLFTVGQAVSEVDWVMVASVSAVAGIYSIVTSIAGLPEVEGAMELALLEDVEEEDIPLVAEPEDVEE